MQQLNINERQVLQAMMDNAEDAAGGDFGFIDELGDYVSMNPQALGGYITQLQSKGLVYVYGGDEHGQFGVEWEKAKEALQS